MRFVAWIQPGPQWRAGATVYEQGEPIEQHLAAMCDRYDEGRLLLGGPFQGGRAGIAVLNVADEAEARALMDADPAVQVGVFVYELHRVRAYFDAFDGTRTADAVASLPRPRS